MDVIKAELEVDPLALETSDDSDEKEKKCILESVQISTQIKIEGEDNIYDLSSEMKYESQEGNLSHLEVTDMKTECRDNNHVIKTEIKVEDTTPVRTSFPMVKSEVDEDSSDLDRVHQEQKMEASTEDNEMFSERNLETEKQEALSQLNLPNNAEAHSMTSRSLKSELRQKSFNNWCRLQQKDKGVVTYSEDQKTTLGLVIEEGYHPQSGPMP
ncbi:uncharacterized protein PF3D7_1120000-like isoform X2 [Periplaneta americana]|uniref:uncharacterized protein PF3D7_1120000-like isoform X2 n=1 Tax=Periplaneta americana TaxID=6978 RepID=UPI0037E8F6B5